MLKGDWEEFTIRIDAPPEGYDKGTEKMMLEITDQFQEELAKLIGKYGKIFPEGWYIQATDSEDRILMT